MNEYIEKLKIEYMHATGKEYNNNEFTKWIVQKRRHLENYYEFLINLGMDEKGKILEFDKGILDSISLATCKDTDVYVISDYASTFKNEKIKNIKATKGSLKMRQNKPYIVNDGKWIHEIPNDIFTYLIEFPDKRTLYELKFLVLLYKDVFIGTYGSINDLNRDEKLKKLESIKEDIMFEYNMDVYSSQTRIADTYMSVLKMKKG